jgi:DNA-binding PadR family transcriptional regulator
MPGRASRTCELSPMVGTTSAYRLAAEECRIVPLGPTITVFTVRPRNAERDQRWSPLRGAVLAMIVQAPPMHGYMLARQIELRLGPAWGVTRQSVYSVLTGLESEGLVASTQRRRPEGDGTGGARGQRVYVPTELAEEALAAWMRSSGPKKPVRVELQAKLAVSRPQDAPLLLDALDAYEGACFAMLRDTHAAEVPMSAWTGVMANLARSAVDESIQAELRWIATARRWIKDFLASTGSS